MNFRYFNECPDSYIRVARLYGGSGHWNYNLIITENNKFIFENLDNGHLVYNNSGLDEYDLKWMVEYMERLDSTVKVTWL